MPVRNRRNRGAQFNRHATNIAALIAVGGLAGCASPVSPVPQEAFDHCNPDTKSDNWQLIEPPMDAKAILALPNEKGTLESELTPYGAIDKQIHEHWFSSGDSRMAVCRHLAGVDSCYSSSTLVYLEKRQDHWVAPGAVLESVCFVHDRAK